MNDPASDPSAQSPQSRRVEHDGRSSHAAEGGPGVETARRYDPFDGQELHQEEAELPHQDEEGSQMPRD